MSEERKLKPLVKLTGLYENQSQRSGETYFSGYLGAVKVVVIRDKNAGPGKPGWSLCVQEKEPKSDQEPGNAGYGRNQRQGYGQYQQPGAQRQGGQPAQQQEYPAQQSAAANHDNDIPF